MIIIQSLSSEIKTQRTGCWFFSKGLWGKTGMGGEGHDDTVLHSCGIVGGKWCKGGTVYSIIMYVGVVAEVGRGKI